MRSILLRAILLLVCVLLLFIYIITAHAWVINHPPVAVDDSYTTHGITYIPAPGVLSNDSDPDGDTIYTQNGYRAATHGIVTYYSDGSFYYSPDSGYSGPDNFVYTVYDGKGEADTATITFNVVNSPPTAVTDYYVVRGIIYIPAPGMLANDSDPDGDPIHLAYAGVTGGSQHGTATTFSDGSFYFEAVPDYVGPDSFKYTVCDFDVCSEGTVNLFITDQDDENVGVTSCNAQVGGPINVTNGNMYLQQTDYQLPGVGEALGITRTYNSMSQRVGLFGAGWSTAYDESIKVHSSTLLQLYLPDGRAVDFRRPDGTGAFTPMQGDFHGQVVNNADGSYSLSLLDGGVHRFNGAGKLLSLSDRNNNQTALTYDANNRLISATDPFGRTLAVANDANGRALSLSDSLGTIATYAYGSGDELLSVTYADGSGFRFGYELSPGLVLTSVTDMLGNIVESHTYDALGRALTSEKQGGVERVTLNYVSDTETDVTDALNHVTRYYFDKSRPRNVVTKVEGVCSCGGSSQSQTWTYDDRLNVTARTNALNQTTTFTYDADGNQLTETNALGTKRYTYNQFGQVLTNTDVMNGVTTNTYDAQGNLLSVTDALNNTTAFTYDARGQLLSMTDARFKVTGFAYNTSGNLIQKTDAFGSVTKYAYDARGRITKVTDALSKATAYAYDAVGRVNKITYFDASFVTFSYDLAGRRTAATDARNNSTTYAYDGAYRLTSETDAAGKVTTYSYDLMSNLTGKTDALGNTTNYEYDDFNRLVKTIHPSGVPGGTRGTEALAYDAGGNVTQATDPEGRATSYEYDAANRLVKLTEANLKVTRYEYDARSNLTAVVDALNQRYVFSYDSLGRVTQVTRGGVSMSFVYDAMGNQTQRTDYNGARTTYTYDALNRLTKITYPNAATVLYTYNKVSRLTTATNAVGRVTLHYNGMWRLNSTTDVFNQVIDYTFDANGNRAQMSYGAQVEATYEYDQMNRVTRITDGAGQVVTYGYDDEGKLTSRTLPNGVNTSYQYNRRPRLTRIQDTIGASTIADHQYTYSASGRITQDTDPDGTRLYTYGAVYRLYSVSANGQTVESYRADAVGNRTSSHLSASYEHEPFNRLVRTATASYSYDTNGNLLTKTENSGVWQYSWDYENRLTKVVRPDGVSVSYKYDALGRRVQRTPSNGVSTNYIYDGQEVVKDLNSDGSTVEYLNGPGIDNKVRQESSTAGVHYYQVDHLGSTRALTDASGNVVERASYDSFGNGTGSARTRYGYTGRERDELTGLYYYRARWYDPQIGRFISEDPIGFGGGINFYAYVSNNPVSFSDPFGLCPQETSQYTPCHVMADIAQDIADDVSRQFPDNNLGAFARDMSIERRNQFDTRFSALYLGRRLDSLGAAKDLSRANYFDPDPRQINPKYIGE